jgi:hypothetical protein
MTSTSEIHASATIGQSSFDDHVDKAWIPNSWLQTHLVRHYESGCITSTFLSLKRDVYPNWRRAMEEEFDAVISNNT